MMRALSLAAVFALATTIAKADPPTVTSVAPTSGPASGGTIVHVTGTNLGLPPGCLSCFTYLQFDDLRVPPLQGDTDTDLFFSAPSHAPGIVDLSFIAPGYGTLPIGTFRYDNVDHGWVRVLLPVLATATAGAHGSSWSTEVTFGTTVATDIHAICTNPIASPCPGNIHLDPAMDVDLDAASINAYRGPGFVHIPVSAASSVSLNARIRDLSQGSRDFGTEMPAVRDRDFRNSLRLLAIPTDPRFRLTLRVYSLTGADTTVHLRVVAENRDATLVDTSIGLINGDTGGLSFAPAWTQIPLDTVYPEIMTGQRVRIEIERSNQPLWAFVSITNNETQHVTLVTPW